MLVSKTKALGLNILKFFQGVSKQAKDVIFDLVDIHSHSRLQSTLNIFDFQSWQAREMVVLCPVTSLGPAEWILYLAEHLNWVDSSVPCLLVTSATSWPLTEWQQYLRTTEMGHCSVWMPSSTF